MSKGKNTTPNPAPAGISKDRARQLSNAMIVVRILDDEYFEKALGYINANKKDEFVKLCEEEAKIPQDLAERMWAYATAKVSQHVYQW